MTLIFINYVKIYLTKIIYCAFETNSYTTKIIKMVTKNYMLKYRFYSSYNASNSVPKWHNIITLCKILIKIQPNATVCRYLFTAKSLYMFRVSQHPSSGVLKTVTATSVQVIIPVQLLPSNVA